MIRWSEKQERMIAAPFNHTIDWLEGTPRSGKTTAGIARFATNLIASTDTNHLVTAYSAEQAYRLIMDGDGMGLMHIFKGICKPSHDDLGAHLVIDLPSGQKHVYWKGGGKADSLKAITGMSLGSVYFCEINLLHIDMVQECLRRTYASKRRWHIADCNPPAPNDPSIEEVLNVQDCRFVHWTCKDNPMLTPKRLHEIEEACKKSPYLYKRDWLGERTIPIGVIYWMFDTQKHILSSFPESVVKKEMFFAGDGGTTDATSIGCYIVGETISGEHKLYRVGNYYYDRGEKAMSVQAKEICGSFIPYMRQKYGMIETGIYIDPACKALRLEISRLGFNAMKADNNAHDISSTSQGLKLGIEMFQSTINDGRFFLVEDLMYGTGPFVKEAGLYCTDSNGNPIDANNHAMDECRYGHNHFAKKYKLWPERLRLKTFKGGI